MKVKLKNIVDAQFGLVLNRKEDKSMTSKIKYRVLQSKSVKDNLIDLENVSCFHSKEEIDDDYFTKTKDILFKVTEPFDTVLINDATSGLLVAANFIVLRVKSKKIYAKFLHWYLGRLNTKNKIKLLTQGTSIISIRTSDLLELNIDIPALDKQKRIMEFLELSEKELILLKGLLNNKELLYKQIPEKLLKK